MVDGGGKIGYVLSWELLPSVFEAVVRRERHSTYGGNAPK